MDGNEKCSDLTNRFITSSTSSHRPTQSSESHKDSLPSASPPPTFLFFFPDSPAFRFLEPFKRHIIQLVILYPQFLSSCPEISTITNNPNIKWIASLTCSCEPI